MSQEELVEDKDQFEGGVEYVLTEKSKRIVVEKSMSNVYIIILTVIVYDIRIYFDICIDIQFL